MVKTEIRLANEGPENEPAVQLDNGNTDDVLSFIDQAVSESCSNADTDEAGGLPIVLRQYLSRPAVNRKLNPNPFVIWQSMMMEYPSLWKVAEKMLPVMATSVPCERLFSHAGLIVNQLRSRLSPQHLKELLFLRSIQKDMWE